LPIYEYQCQQCQHRFELLQRFSDPQVTTCPRCGGEVRQIISAPAVQFKGSGWYVTDYARKSSTPAGHGAKKAESKTDTPFLLRLGTVLAARRFAFRGHALSPFTWIYLFRNAPARAGLSGELSH
jgi:putative FmdB family regulatory protein